MKQAPQFWIDTFKEKGRFLQNGHYSIHESEIRGTYVIFIKAQSDYVRDGNGAAIFTDDKSEAIQAAWEHFISQPEVRGLMEEWFNKGKTAGIAETVNKHTAFKHDEKRYVFNDYKPTKP